MASNPPPNPLNRSSASPVARDTFGSGHSLALRGPGSIKSRRLCRAASASPWKSTCHPEKLSRAASTPQPKTVLDRGRHGDPVCWRQICVQCLRSVHENGLQRGNKLSPHGMRCTASPLTGQWPLLLSKWQGRSTWPWTSRHSGTRSLSPGDTGLRPISGGLESWRRPAASQASCSRRRGRSGARRAGNEWFWTHTWALQIPGPLCEICLFHWLLPKEPLVLTPRLVYSVTHQPSYCPRS